MMTEERLADAFTWFHLRVAGGCSESHLADARRFLSEQKPYYATVSGEAGNRPPPPPPPDRG